MNTYEIADENRTTEFTVMYIIILACLFFAGKVATLIFYILFSCDFTSWMNDKFWPVPGIIFVFIFIAYVRSFAYLQVKGDEWVVTQHRFIDSDHWHVHPGGDHVISLFHKEVRRLGLFKTEGEVIQEARALDATISIVATVTAEPISPLFILLNEKDAAGTALKFGQSTVEALIDAYTSYFTSVTILKSGQAMTKWVQSWLDVDEELKKLGIKVTVRVKKLDESIDVVNARKKTLKARESRMAVDALAGVDCYLIYEDTGELIFDSDGKPIIVPPDIGREEAAAILLAEENKGQFNRNYDERRIIVEGDPEILKALRFTGALGNQDEGSSNHR